MDKVVTNAINKRKSVGRRRSCPQTPEYIFSQPTMFGCHQFPVTREDDDDNTCTLTFSSLRTAVHSPQHAILVEVLHPSYGVIVRIHHFFADCPLDNELCARHQVMHPGLPAPLDAQLWPRHMQISLGNTVWKATDAMISESRAEERSWVYMAETQSKSEPGTPFEDDETGCSCTE